MRSISRASALALALLVSACHAAGPRPAGREPSLVVLGRPFDHAIVQPTQPWHPPRDTTLREFRVDISGMEIDRSGDTRMRGTVRDAETGTGVSAHMSWITATVPVRAGVVESSGRFEVSIRDVEGATLRVRNDGYRTMEIDVSRFAGMARRPSRPVIP